jgi:hypothetical protein
MYTLSLTSLTRSDVVLGSATLGSVPKGVSERQVVIG